MSGNPNPVKRRKIWKPSRPLTPIHRQHYRSLFPYTVVQHSNNKSHPIDNTEIRLQSSGTTIKVLMSLDVETQTGWFLEDGMRMDDGYSNLVGSRRFFIASETASLVVLLAGKTKTQFGEWFSSSDFFKLMPELTITLWRVIISISPLYTYQNCIIFKLPVALALNPVTIAFA